MAQIRAITVLRGIAALLVVLFHAALDVRGRGHDDVFPPFLFGAAGVDVFFVLSGFVMVISSVGEGRPMLAGRFCRRRIERIVPMYWLATLATLVHQVLANRHSFLLDDWPRHLACSLAFLPCYRTALPLVVQGWTLEYEMAFYGMFALALAAGRVGAVQVLMVCCLVAGLCSFFGLPASGPYGSSSLLAEFSFGMAVAFCRPSGLKGSTGMLAVLVGILALWCVESFLANPPAWRLIVWGIPATLVVAGCCCIPNEWVPGASKAVERLWLPLGDASYAIYLFHILAFKIAGRPVLGLMHHGILGLWAYFAIITAAALGLGVMVHIVVERRLQAWLRQPRHRMGDPGLAGGAKGETLMPAALQRHNHHELAAGWVERSRNAPRLIEAHSKQPDS